MQRGCQGLQGHARNSFPPLLCSCPEFLIFLVPDAARSSLQSSPLLPSLLWLKARGLPGKNFEPRLLAILLGGAREEEEEEGSGEGG